MYNRQIAIEYAYKWWNNRNPQFFNFDSLGGDCTNFVSQCLYSGGIQMDFSHPGWYYSNINNRSPSWTGVEQFFEYATSNNSVVGIKAKIVSISEIEPGDVVQLCQHGNNFHHSLFITKIDQQKKLDNIYITCHTNDAKDKKLSDYHYNKIRFLKILN